MTHAVPLELRLREDVVLPSMATQDALKGAPRRDGDLFVVPAIISGAGVGE
jgi:Asp-tRNA(Asn)/Glu-tRNA(Gln) amidotransferase C subunit